MDGLECTEILYSQLNAELRIDAEYFHKVKLKMQETIRKSQHVAIGDIAVVTDGIHTSIDYDDDSNVKLISATSPRKNVFNLSRNAFISVKAHEKNPRTALREKDVILSTVGTIGNCAVVDESILPANSDRHVGIIRLNTTINPYMLSSFLLTKYGRNQTVRESTGNVQLNLFLYKIREILVPIFTDDFQNAIQDAVLKAQNLLKVAENLYREAEAIVDNDIAVDYSKISTENKAIKTLSNTFGKTGRIDAKYYQYCHDDMIASLGNFGTIRTLCNLYDKTYTPDANEYYKYIELANIGKMGEIDDVDVVAGNELPTRARRLAKKDNVIVSSVEGSIDSCALITDEYDGALCSTGFYVIDSNYYNSETLMVLLKSKPIQSLLKRGCSGTILTNITKDEFLDIPLPLISKDAQVKTKNIITEVYELRGQSKQLIDAVIQSIEMAIESNEKESLEWLNGKVTELTVVPEKA